MMCPSIVPGALKMRKKLMMNNLELVVLTSRKKFFGQTRKPWSSLDVDKMIGMFEARGYKVTLYEFHQLINSGIQLKNKTIFYAFSQKENYRQYIRDIMYSLSKDNRIIPSYDFLMCHENKGYQEIFKKHIGFEGLRGEYYTSANELDPDSIKYPIILKAVKGSNGKGVFLVKDKKALKKTTDSLKNKFSLFTNIDLLRRKYFRKKKFSDYPLYSDRQDYLEYKEYLEVEENFVLQQFVPDLDFDYRVLIAHDRYYVMKRSVKKGDFRASGSKKFSFSKIPEKALLNYARGVYQYFDTPFLSIDVLFNGTQYDLVEFQALHFGTSSITKSTGFFQSAAENQWQYVDENPELEKVFATTIMAYLEQS